MWLYSFEVPENLNQGERALSMDEDVASPESATPFVVSAPELMPRPVEHYFAESLG